MKLEKILYVEDDQDYRDIVREYFSTYEVVAMESATQALKNITDYGEFKVIISDYYMPEMNGLEFLKELESKENLPPFIIYSSVTSLLSKKRIKGVHALFERSKLEEMVKFVNLLNEKS